MKNWLDLSGTSNRYKQMYIKGFLDISGGNLILRNNDLHVLNGNSNLNGNVNITGNTTVNKLFINSDLSLNGTLNYNFKDNTIPSSAIIGGIPANSGVFSIDLSLNNGLSVASDVSINSRLYVTGKTILNNDVSMNNNLYVKNSIYENGILLSSKYVTSNSPTFTGTVSGITASMIGLGNVNNTSDITKPISVDMSNALLLKANILSPDLSGIPTAPTAATSTNTRQIATTAFVVNSIGAASANYATTSNTSIIGYLTTPKLFVTNDASLNARLYVAGDTSMNGNLKINKQLVVNSTSILNNDVSMNTRLFVQNSIYENGTSLSSKYSTLDTPTFTGIPKAPTATSGTNTSQLATTLFVRNEIANLINGAPATLDTLNELANAINSDANFSATISTQIGLRANIASPTFTGYVTLPDTYSTSTTVANDSSFNSRLYISGDTSMNANLSVGSAIYEGGQSLINKYATQTALNLKAPIASPSFTGYVTLPDTYSTSTTVANDSSFNSRLYISGDTSMNANLSVGSAIYEGGQSLINKYATQTALNLKAPIASPSFTGTTTIQNAYINNDMSLNSHLDLSGSLIAHTNLNVYGVINQQTLNLTDGYLTSFDNNSLNDISNLKSLINTTTSNSNTLIGKNSGSNITTGLNNLVLGYNSASSSATISNEVTLGNSSITSLRCAVSSITSLSDERDKTNIENLETGLDFISLLRPVKFDWNTRDGNKTNIPDIGFIAQELLFAEKTSGKYIPNLVNTSNEDKLEANYGQLLPILVKSIQELNSTIVDLKKTVANQEMIIHSLLPDKM